MNSGSSSHASPRFIIFALLAAIYISDVWQVTARVVSGRPFLVFMQAHWTALVHLRALRDGRFDELYARYAGKAAPATEQRDEG